MCQSDTFLQVLTCIKHIWSNLVCIFSQALELLLLFLLLILAVFILPLFVFSTCQDLKIVPISDLFLTAFLISPRPITEHRFSTLTKKISLRPDYLFFLNYFHRGPSLSSLSVIRTSFYQYNGTKRNINVPLYQPAE